MTIIGSLSEAVAQPYYYPPPQRDYYGSPPNYYGPAPGGYYPPPVVPPYNWSGFYIGGNLGVGFNNTGGVSDTFGSTFGTTNNTQFLGGGQVGVNYEFLGGAVIGAEAMFDWLPNTQNTITVTNDANTANVTLNNRWLTTVTGKLGYAWGSFPFCSMAKAAVLGLEQAVRG